MRIAFESASQADAVELIAELDAYQAALYPPESHHALDLSAVPRQQLLFAIARSEQGLALACGAVLLTPAYGELKRMYVRPSARGQGLARKILLMLETAAAQAGCNLLKLETGPLQLEALGLYTDCGFQSRARFGAYRDDPLSVFMEKRL